MAARRGTWTKTHTHTHKIIIVDIFSCCFRRVECVVCGSKISGLFGKQAYICQGTLVFFDPCMAWHTQCTYTCICSEVSVHKAVPTHTSLAHTHYIHSNYPRPCARDKVQHLAWVESAMEVSKVSKSFNWLQIAWLRPQRLQNVYLSLATPIDHTQVLFWLCTL